MTHLSPPLPRQDATNLLNVLGNASLASELRRSAAEQLTALAYQEPALLAVMSAPEHLHRVVAAAAAASEGLTASGGGPGGALEGSGMQMQALGGAEGLRGAGAGDGRAGARAQGADEHGAAGGMPLAAGAAGEVQLALACVNLAYVVACLSPGARRWLTARDGGAALTWRLLPLLLHPLITVRRSAARLTAALVFLEEAGKHPTWLHARHAAPGGTEAVTAAADQRGASASAATGGRANTGGGAGVCGAGVAGSGASTGAAASAGARSALLQLPEPFSAAYLMPCKVAWLAMDTGGAAAAAAPGRGPGLPPNKLQGRLGSCVIHLYLRPLLSAAHSQVQGVDPRQKRHIAGKAALHCHRK